jgi:hypothetical protein
VGFDQRNGFGSINDLHRHGRLAVKLAVKTARVPVASSVLKRETMLD